MSYLRLPDKLHPENVSRVLRKAGLKSIKKKKKPFLSKKHRKQRLDFAQKYANRTVEDFKRVIWSDRRKLIEWVPMGWSGHGGNYSTVYKIIMFKVPTNMVGVA